MISIASARCEVVNDAAHGAETEAGSLLTEHYHRLMCERGARTTRAGGDRTHESISLLNLRK